jgi:hypothetical protein
MHQKFEMDGDHVELILTYPGGDIFRAPVGTLLSMATLNDGELLRYSYQPPAADPFDPDSPRPPRVHCVVRVETLTDAEAAEALVLVEGEYTQIIPPTTPAPAPTTVRCSDCSRLCRSADELAEHRRVAHPAPRRITPRGQQ